jgi:hypothetical protein
MGRKKKTVNIDKAKFDSMSREDKLALFHDFNQLFNYELSKIPYDELFVSATGKAETIAENYFQEKGYHVYHSRVNGGYRSIGVEFYWRDFEDKISIEDRALIGKLKSLMTPAEFMDLAMMVKDKNGTPDLLLIKDDKISFVEIKYNYETVKTSTVEFYIKYGDKWPTSILRIIKK